MLLRGGKIVEKREFLQDFKFWIAKEIVSRKLYVNLKKHSQNSLSLREENFFFFFPTIVASPE